jgi:hypothetical protein
MRRAIQGTMVAAACLAVMLGLVLAWGLVRPGWVQWGRLSVGTATGNLEVAWSSLASSREQNGWVIRGPGAMGTVILGPESRWRPTVSSGAVGVIGGPSGKATIMRVSALYVPLWTWSVGLGVLAALLWWFGPRVVGEGCCANCGYDLRGTPGGRCPECGRPGAGVVARILALARRFRPRMAVAH